MPAQFSGRRKALAVIGLTLAAAMVVTGCRDTGGDAAPVPASFTPSPCPPGWQRIPDAQDPGAWSCFISGTLSPGQNLPLPTISGTPVPSPGKTPAGSPAVQATPAGNDHR